MNLAGVEKVFELEQEIERMQERMRRLQREADRMEREMRAAIALHLEWLAADGEPIREPSGPGVYVERKTAAVG
jgi:MerR family transcriptional regulator/heat shock protein HspR